jgi:hypothetical protein
LDIGIHNRRGKTVALTREGEAHQRTTGRILIVL